MCYFCLYCLDPVCAETALKTLVLNLFPETVFTFTSVFLECLQIVDKRHFHNKKYSCTVKPLYNGIPRDLNIFPSSDKFLFNTDPYVFMKYIV